MIIKEENHSFIHPWGEFIYKGVLSNNDLSFFKEQAEYARTSKSKVGDALAGNIKEQYLASDQTYANQKQMFTILDPHIKNYIRHLNDRTQSLQKLFLKPKYRNDVFDVENIKYNLGKGPWFNFMKKNEFNPLHCHTGNISGILMIKVPKEIERESKTFIVETNLRCPGQLEWIGSGPAGQKVTPTEGEIYLFDSTLRHQVYPFQSDVERITSSFNVHQEEIK
jgi:hypothetical protein